MRATQRPCAALWDMDGTLVDSEPLWLEIENEMLGRYGLGMSEELREAMIGTGLTEGAQRFQEFGVPLSVDEIIDEWKRGVAALIRANAPAWRPGAVELLESLGEAGIPCVLVTMSVREIADATLEMLPRGLFTAVIAGDEVEFEKPHPDPYLRGAAVLGVDIAECIAFEDSRTGLAAAHGSGAVTIGIPHQQPLDDAASHELWPSFEGVDAHRVIERFRALR